MRKPSLRSGSCLKSLEEISGVGQYAMPLDGDLTVGVPHRTTCPLCDIEFTAYRWIVIDIDTRPELGVRACDGSLQLIVLPGVCRSRESSSTVPSCIVRRSGEMLQIENFFPLGVVDAALARCARHARGAPRVLCRARHSRPRVRGAGIAPRPQRRRRLRNRRGPLARPEDGLLPRRLSPMRCPAAAGDDDGRFQSGAAPAPRFVRGRTPIGSSRS